MKRIILILALSFLPLCVWAQQPPQISFKVNGKEVALHSFSVSPKQVLVNNKEIPVTKLPADLQSRVVELQKNGGFFTWQGMKDQVFLVEDQYYIIQNDQVLPYNSNFESQDDFEDFLIEQNTYIEQMPQQQYIVPVERTQWLFDIREDAPELYDQKLHEYWLEERSKYLGVQIQITPEGDNRRKMMEELRNMVSELFELKQENLMMEIEQLQSELITLRQRARDREKAKEQIIEQRLRELIGQ